MTSAIPKISHPALCTGYSTSTLYTSHSTPHPTHARSHLPKGKASRSRQVAGRSQVVKVAPPVPSNHLLRQAHVCSLNYMIARLRWDQANNGYIHGESAWHFHNKIIGKLDKELEAAQAAQAQDKFPNCASPMVFPKPHGPLTREAFDKEKLEAAENEKVANHRLDHQFPWIRQLFIGPRTKKQALYDKVLRERLKDGDSEDLEILLPSENMRLLEHLQRGDGNKGGGDGNKKQKKSYKQIRYEKEQAKVAQALRAADIPVPPTPGPNDEQGGAVPYGPMTKSQALLRMQRDQRALLINWLRRPWTQFNPEAAPYLEKLTQVVQKEMKVKMEVKKLEGDPN